MLVFLVPPVLAGLLGLLAHQAGDAAAYVPRVRVMLLGAVGLAYLGVAFFVWRKLYGWKRWGALLLALLAMRVAYVPFVGGALVVTGWLDWIARVAGAQKHAAALHYALACFTAAFAGLGALLVLSAVTHLRNVGWVLILLLWVGMGVLAFWHPDDRKISPHPFAEKAPVPATTGGTYLDVAEDSEQRLVTRILATGGVLRHSLQPRRGWSGALRDELVARYRGEPALSLGERMTCLEAALLRARP